MEIQTQVNLIEFKASLYICTRQWKKTTTAFTDRVQHKQTRLSTLQCKYNSMHEGSILIFSRREDNSIREAYDQTLKILQNQRQCYGLKYWILFGQH